jgi:hypothetical protein
MGNTGGGGGGAYFRQSVKWFLVELSTAPEGLQPMLRLYGGVHDTNRHAIGPTAWPWLHCP